MATFNNSWNIVQSAFEMEEREPTEKESELVAKWINEWNISEDLLKCAYNTCIQNKSRFIMKYIEVLLESWYKNGVNSPADIRKSANQPDKDGYAAYDLDLFEKMLNEKY